MAVVCQAASPAPPASPVLDTARAARKVVVVKAASGVVAQSPAFVHSDGASTIHSAERVSTAAARSTLVNAVPRVRFLMDNVTVCPATAALACSSSPGRIVMRALCEMSGTTSYHAEYVAWPGALQSASVPICSSARDVCA